MKYIVVHCSATPPALDWGAAEIDASHKQRGFARIGYNYVIRRDGRVEMGREEGDELAHAKGFNAPGVAVAVCLIGGVLPGDTKRPNPGYTREQWRSLRTFVEWMRLKYPQAELLGHRDLPGVNKACPSFDVRHWWETGEIINPEKPNGPS